GNAAGGGTAQVLVPTFNTAAVAGGGTAVVAGSVSVSLHVNAANVAANTYWAATRATEAGMEGQSLVEGFAQPLTNLGERMRNLVDGRGPRTHEERREDD